MTTRTCRLAAARRRMRRRFGVEALESRTVLSAVVAPLAPPEVLVVAPLRLVAEMPLIAIIQAERGLALAPAGTAAGGVRTNAVTRTGTGERLGPYVAPPALALPLPAVREGGFGGAAAAEAEGPQSTQTATGPQAAASFIVDGLRRAAALRREIAPTTEAAANPPAAQSRLTVFAAAGNGAEQNGAFAWDAAPLAAASAPDGPVWLQLEQMRVPPRTLIGAQFMGAAAPPAACDLFRAGDASGGAASPRTRTVGADEGGLVDIDVAPTVRIAPLSRTIQLRSGRLAAAEVEEAPLKQADPAAAASAVPDSENSAERSAAPAALWAGDGREGGMIELAAVGGAIDLADVAAGMALDGSLRTGAKVRMDNPICLFRAFELASVPQEAGAGASDGHAANTDEQTPSTPAAVRTAAARERFGEPDVERAGVLSMVIAGLLVSAVDRVWRDDQTAGRTWIERG